MFLFRYWVAAPRWLAADRPQLPAVRVDGLGRAPPPGFESWTKQGFVAALVVAVVQAWLLWTPGGRRVLSARIPAVTVSPASDPVAASPWSTVAPVRQPGPVTATSPSVDPPESSSLWILTVAPADGSCLGLPGTLVKP